MRIDRVSVTGLFGNFDHEVRFFNEERITIIHAPNGYGKTVLLRLIAGFFGGSLAIFRQIPFNAFSIHFVDGTSVEVCQQKLEAEQERFFATRFSRSYSISYHADGSCLVYDPDNRDKELERRTVSPMALERYTPLIRVGPRKFRHPGTSTFLSFEEAVERYWERLPPHVRRGEHLPDWLTSVRESLNCQLVETQRLLISRKDGAPSDASENSFVPAIRTYAENLTNKIGATLSEAATLSQSLERTFPARLLTRMREYGSAHSEDEVRKRLADLERKRARLAQVDLAEKSDDVTIIPEDRLEQGTLRVLTEYISDAEKKLDVYDDLLLKVELFSGLINEKFSFKRVKINRKKGFFFENELGDELGVEALSSGEQHELILFYKLIFETQKNTLMLIDEPEISLHIAWQKHFLSDLREIVQLSPMDVVVATHSPQLIGPNIDLTVELRGPRRG